MTLFNSQFNVSFDTFPGYQPHWYWQPTKNAQTLTLRWRNWLSSQEKNSKKHTKTDQKAQFQLICCST